MRGHGTVVERGARRRHRPVHILDLRLRDRKKHLLGRAVANVDTRAR
jgi:hypothetical protein